MFHDEILMEDKTTIPLPLGQTAKCLPHDGECHAQP